MALVRPLYTTRGAVAAVATALGISQAAVSQWTGRGIPDDRVDDVRRALDAHLAHLDALNAARASKAARVSA